MRQSASRPSACQKLIWRHPKSGGSSQFHSSRTAVPPRKVNSTMPRIAAGTMNIHLLLMSPSPFPQLVMEALQSLAQVEHGVPLPREQRVDAHARLGGQLAERAALQLVRDEHLALLLGQLLDRLLELVEQHAAGVE